MKEILSKLRKNDGSAFAKEWIQDTNAGFPQFQKLRNQRKERPIRKVDSKLCSRVNWLRN